MIETIDDNGDTIRSMTPPEYIKFANQREHRVKHAVDLHHFLGYLQNTAGLLREMPENRIDALIADYLDEVEPKNV